MLPNLFERCDYTTSEFRKSIISGRPKTMMVIDPSERLKYVGIITLLTGNKCNIYNEQAAAYTMPHDIIFNEGISLDDITFKVEYKEKNNETYCRIKKLPNDMLDETMNKIALGEITEAAFAVNELTIYDSINGKNYLSKFYTDVRFDDNTVDLFNDSKYHVSTNSEKVRRLVNSPNTMEYTEHTDLAMLVKTDTSFGLTVSYILQKIMGNEELHQFISKCKCKIKYCGKEITITKYSIACQKLINYLVKRMMNDIPS